MNTEDKQDSSCERVSLAYLVLKPTETFQIKCKTKEGSWFMVSEIALQKAYFLYGRS